MRGRWQANPSAMSECPAMDEAAFTTHFNLVAQRLIQYVPGWGVE